MANIFGNNMEGDITKPINAARGSGILTSYNTYNSNPLINRNSEVSGTAEFYLQTSDAVDTLQMIRLDVSEYNQGSAFFEIEIQVTANDTSFFGNYKFYAYGTYTISSMPIFGVDFKEQNTYKGNDSLYLPTLQWQGAGSTRTLAIICNTYYTGYFIRVKYIGWRLRVLDIIN